MNNYQLRINNHQLPEGYKQTEVGIIPEDWNYESLQDKVDLISGRHILTQKYNSGGIGTPYLTGPADFKDDTSIVSKWTREKGVEAEYGNVLITVKGSGAGSSFKLDLPKAVISRQLMALKGKKILQNYLFYIIKNKELELSAKAVGNLIPGLSRTDIFTLKVVLPGAEEQRAIAQVLSDVNALITMMDKLIAKKRNLKTATMQQLLTGKKRLPGFGEGQGYKESAIGLIPEDWNVKNIGEDAVTYSGGTPSTGNTEYYFGQIPWITSGDLNKRYILEVNGRISEKGLNNSSANMVSANTLLIALYGATAGVSAISRIEAAINQAVLAILPRSLDRNYLFYVLGLRKDQIIETYTQGGQPNLSGEIIRSLLIAAPTPQEQRAIATVLSDMDAEIATLESRLAKTQAIKQGMMQELLTGRIRLKIET